MAGLPVYFEQRPVGAIDVDKNGPGFTYDRAWISLRGAFPISTTMPFRPDRYGCVDHANCSRECQHEQRAKPHPMHQRPEAPHRDLHLRSSPCSPFWFAVIIACALTPLKNRA